MPTYLCHGFRWHRDAIRFFIIVQDIDDAAPEWVVAPRSADALLAQFYDLFDFLPYRGLEEQPTSNEPAPPRDALGARGGQAEQAGSGDDPAQTEKPPSKRGKSPSRPPKTEPRDELSAAPAPRPPDPALEEEEPPPPSTWSAVRLLEEFDPSNLSIVSGPWAYVADHVVRVDTSASVVEEILRYEALERSREPRAMSSTSSGPRGMAMVSDETTAGRATVGDITEGGGNYGWLERLRDKLQSDEIIRWYVVVCGDEERDAAICQEEEEEEEEEDSQCRCRYQSQREDEDQTIGATSEGHHEQQPQRGEAVAAAERGYAGGKNKRGSGFEFRLPEFLDSRKAQPREAKADWNAVLEKPPPFFKKEPPAAATVPPPLPAGAAAAHKTSVEAGKRQKTSKTSGFRRFFARRLRGSSK